MLKLITFTLLFSLIGTCLYSQTKEKLPCVDKEFSVVAHIFLDSLKQPNITEAQINSIYTKMNELFKPICISFKVCEFVYHPEFEYDDHTQKLEWAELQVLYNKPNRINVYYVNTIIEPRSACGFAGLGSIANLNSNGIVIQKQGSCCGITSKTHAHEFGHYFNLFHTFETSNGAEKVDGSNCSTAGDLVCDTPADPFVETDNVNFYVDPNCHFISMKKDANGDYYDPITSNIMSYYPDVCEGGFTHGQLMRMAKYYLANKGMW